MMSMGPVQVEVVTPVTAAGAGASDSSSSVSHHKPQQARTRPQSLCFMSKSDRPPDKRTRYSLLLEGEQMVTSPLRVDTLQLPPSSSAARPSTLSWRNPNTVTTPQSFTSSSPSSLDTTPVSTPGATSPARPTIRAISGDDLAERLMAETGTTSAERQLLLLDCRSFLAANTRHIRGAVTLNCSDRIHRKRLCGGKIARLSELVVSGEERKVYEDLVSRPRAAGAAGGGGGGVTVVCYDEQGDVEYLRSEARHNHPLLLVLAQLEREDAATAATAPALVLQGGISQFKRDHSSLCEDSLRDDAPAAAAAAAVGSCCGGAAAPIYSSPTSAPLLPPHHPADRTAAAAAAGAAGPGLEAVERSGMSQILPLLYLGNERDAGCRHLLRERGITHVLNVTSHVPTYFDDDGVTYKRLPATDCIQQNLSKYFNEAYHFIEEARRSRCNVLVHCHAGISRSATITVAYTMRYQDQTMLDAYRFVKSRRTIISPNLNFMGQLVEYEKTLRPHCDLDHQRSEDAHPNPFDNFLDEVSEKSAKSSAAVNGTSFTISVSSESAPVATREDVSLCTNAEHTLHSSQTLPTSQTQHPLTISKPQDKLLTSQTQDPLLVSQTQDSLLTSQDPLLISQTQDQLITSQESSEPFPPSPDSPSRSLLIHDSLVHPLLTSKQCRPGEQLRRPHIPSPTQSLPKTLEDINGLVKTNGYEHISSRVMGSSGKNKRRAAQCLMLETSL